MTDDWEEEMSKLCTQQIFLLTFNTATVRFDSGHELECFFAFTDDDYAVAMQRVKELDLDGVMAVFEEPTYNVPAKITGYEAQVYNVDKEVIANQDLSATEECCYMIVVKSGTLPAGKFEIL